MIGRRRRRVGGGAAAGVPEHRSGVRRYRDVAVVRVLEHVHGWDQTQRRHHRCVVLDSLHSHVNSVDQVCPHRLARQRQWRWYVVSALICCRYLFCDEGNSQCSTFCFEFICMPTPINGVA